jgi:hypothetical protein
VDSSRGWSIHFCTTVYISFVIFYRKYTGRAPVARFNQAVSEGCVNVARHDGRGGCEGEQDSGVHDCGGRRGRRHSLWADHEDDYACDRILTYKHCALCVVSAIYRPPPASNSCPESDAHHMHARGGARPSVCRNCWASCQASTFSDSATTARPRRRCRATVQTWSWWRRSAT